MEKDKKETKEGDVKFSADWFSGNISTWNSLLKEFAGTACEALEVGSFEGRSAIWLVQNILTHKDAKLQCVDTFLGEPTFTKEQRENLFDKFSHNINVSKVADKITVHKGFSGPILSSLRSSCASRFNIIYIDGSHETRNVLEDAVLAWPLLKCSGILIFDDYGAESVKKGVDAFVECNKSQLKICHTGWQLALIKTD